MGPLATVYSVYKTTPCFVGLRCEQPIHIGPVISVLQELGHRDTMSDSSCGYRLEIGAYMCYGLISSWILRGSQ